MSRVDELRAPRYARYGQSPQDPPGCRWFVCEETATGKLLACAAIAPSAEGPNGRTLIDVLGDELQAVDELFSGLLRLADKNGWSLTAWMPLDHRSRIQYAMQRAFVPTAMLLRRASAEERATAEQTG